MTMQKLILQYWESEEHVGQWEHLKPFEYSSKDQFILDMIDNPGILRKFEMYFEALEPGATAEQLEDLLSEIEIYTLDEWFIKNQAKF